MNPRIAQRRPYRVCVELLEARELLSSSRSKIPTGNVRLSASPLPITIHLDQNSYPAGDYVAIVKPRVALSGQTAAGARVLLEHSTAKGKMVPVARTKASAQGQYR